MERRERDALQDILTAIRRVQGFPIPDRETFMASDVLQDAVVRNLEIIGEATKRLSDACRQQHPQIPWRQMAGMRDVLIHAYDRVDLEEVWITLSEQLPALQAQIERPDNKGGATSSPLAGRKPRTLLLPPCSRSATATPSVCSRDSNVSP
jgi:uncharacterized protein with HEPN domain